MAVILFLYSDQGFVCFHKFWSQDKVHGVKKTQFHNELVPSRSRAMKAKLIEKDIICQQKRF